MVVGLVLAVLGLSILLAVSVVGCVIVGGGLWMLAGAAEARMREPDKTSWWRAAPADDLRSAARAPAPADGPTATPGEGPDGPACSCPGVAEHSGAGGRLCIG